MLRQTKLWGSTESSITSSTGTSNSPPPSVSRDIREFLSHYGSTSSNPSGPSRNLTFYQNSTPAKPSNRTIEKLQKELRGDYGELEGNHGFIQWIFPIREAGMNWQSQPLEVYEIETIKADPVAMERLLQSYHIMLDFYGMKLTDYSLGTIARTEVVAPSSASWRVRYSNLERSSHNYLRITRILKSNSEFGREHLNAGWLLFFLVEQSRGELNNPSLTRSMDGYWRWCIRNEEDREWVVEKIDKVRKGEKWTDQDYEEAMRRRKETGSFKETVEESS